MSVKEILERLDGVRKLSSGWEARCPAHADRKQSLSIGVGQDGRVLLHCHAGCATDEVLAAATLTMGDLFTEDQRNGGRRRIVATYDYTDEHNQLLFQVVRYEPKEFRQRRPDGSDGWIWKLGDTRRVLYHLPQVIKAVEAGEPIWIVEGEKDVAALERVGLTATCNAGGAAKWRQEYGDHLAGANVVVCGDCDEKGREHAQQIAESLVGKAREVRVLDLAGKEKSDIADFLAAAQNDTERGEARRVLDLAAENASVFGSTTKSSLLVKPNAMLAFAPISQALEDVPDEPAWVWDGYIAPGTISLLAGRPKVGKSTLAFGALEAFSKGATFLDRTVSKSSVLLLSEERPDTLAEKQRRFGLNGSVDLLMRHNAGDTAWKEVVEQAVDYCQLRSISVLVVDTWDKWAQLSGDSENSAGHVLAALEPLQRAAAAGLAVVIIAHQRKAQGAFGEAVRGNNALTGSVDVVVELERPSSEASPSARILRAVSRYSGTPEELAFELTEEGYVACGDEDAIRTRAEKARVWDVLKALVDPATVKEVAEAAEFSQSTARRRLNELVDDGQGVRSGEGGKKDPLRWTQIGFTNPYLLSGGTKSEVDGVPCPAPVVGDV